MQQSCRFLSLFLAKAGKPEVYGVSGDPGAVDAVKRHGMVSDTITPSLYLMQRVEKAARYRSGANRC